MLLDALFRSEPLENPATPITSESAETDNQQPQTDPLQAGFSIYGD